jgi:hypothetical protein
MPSLRRAMSILTISVVFGVAVGAVGCSRSDGTRVGSTDAARPLDTARVSSIDAAEWQHRRSIEADLNGDDTLEHLVIASDVQLSDSATPLWEDGHRWAVFVEETPQLTLLYAAFVPNRHVEVGILAPDAEGRRNVLVQERTPFHIRGRW